MGFFSSSPKKKTGLTQKELVGHHLYEKMRHVFPFGDRGFKKLLAVDQALGIEQDTRRHRPRASHTIEEKEFEEAVNNLIRSGRISVKEATKLREVLDEDLHT